MAEHVVPTPAARLESGKPARVWYGVAAAPTAWVLLSSIDWWITGRACADGAAGWGPLSPGAVRFLLIVLAAIAMGAGGLALASSLQAWRETSASAADPRQAYGYGIGEYLAIVGFFMSAIFLVAMVWTALPALMVDVCQGVR
jgi:hypothetical protein